MALTSGGTAPQGLGPIRGPEREIMEATAARERQGKEKEKEKEKEKLKVKEKEGGVCEKR